MYRIEKDTHTIYEPTRNSLQNVILLEEQLVTQLTAPFLCGMCEECYFACDFQHLLIFVHYKMNQ